MNTDRSCNKSHFQKAIMPVVIMAGGLGKRAADIASDIPKPLIRIAGKPILQWEIECLVRQGFTDIVLTVSHMSRKIMDFFEDGSSLGCSISYFQEEQPLGNAGALFKLWENGKLDGMAGGDFLLLNADSMFDVDLHRFVSFHEEHKALASLFTHPNDHPADSGLIVSENGVVRKWLTKEDARPKWYKNRVNAGLHVMNTALLEFSGIKTVDADHRIDLDCDILKPLVSTGRIYAYDSPEYVKDMGTPERFEQVLKDLNSGRVAGRNLSIPQRAIFLDRDGTINRHVGFLRNMEEFELFEGVAEAVKLINGSGYLCIVVTNQPVIARGELTVPQLEMIHNKMETLLGNEGAYVDALYYCPHHPCLGFPGEVRDLKVECSCRKPKPGLIFQAASDFHIDLSRSFMIGDSRRDMEAGQAAGCKTILLNGFGTEAGENAGESSRQPEEEYDTAPNLLVALHKFIL